MSDGDVYKEWDFSNCVFSGSGSVRFENCSFDSGCSVEAGSQESLSLDFKFCPGYNRIGETAGKSVIGYKQCYFRNSYGGFSFCVVKIRVLEEARRSGCFGSEMRCDSAKVLEIRDMEGTLQPKHRIAYDDREAGLKYKLGRVVAMEEDFDKRPWVEQDKAIHFCLSNENMMCNQMY